MHYKKISAEQISYFDFIFKVFISLDGFLQVSKVLVLLMVITKEKRRLLFFFFSVVYV